MQCIIPAVNGLLPIEHEEVILRMLFTLATYHALGKMRIHTEYTLSYWEHATVCLSNELQHFHDQIADLDIHEMPQEACNRACQNNTAASRSYVRSDWKPKTFSLATYKFHALGDGPAAVCEYGTTDSYSTAIVSSVVTRTS